MFTESVGAYLHLLMRHPLDGRQRQSDENQQTIDKNRANMMPLIRLGKNLIEKPGNRI